MKTSVVLSTYNGEIYIVDQLSSIFKQTMQPDEVLIFDDCSEDNTVSIVENYINSHGLSNWSISINHHNKGWKQNFIDGIRMATGELIFPCDQDDIWKPEKIETMCNVMSDHPEINVLTCNYKAFYEESAKDYIGPEPEDGKLIKQDVSFDIFNTKFPGCTYCIRSSFRDFINIYWEQDFPHDAFFWRLAVFSGSLYSIHKTLINWRKHDDSAYHIESIKVKARDSKRKFLDYAKRVIHSIEDFLTDHDEYNDDRKKEILSTNGEWLKHRTRFYDSGKVVDGLSLIKYRKCYTRFRQYIGDLYLVLLNKGGQP